MRRRPAVKLALPLAAGALLWPVGLVRADVSPTPTPRSCATLELDPIHATFFQSLFATHYDVDGCAPRNARYLTFDWSLQPPTADPGCNHFASDVTVDIFGFDDGDPDEAAWAHGDQDGCNHNVQTVQGHPGTVTVVVADGEATCTASYFGTITGTGNPSACTRTTSGQTATAKAPGTSQTAPGSGFAWWWLLALLAIAMGILSIVFVRRWGGPGGSTYPEYTRPRPFTYPDYSDGGGISPGDPSFGYQDIPPSIDGPWPPVIPGRNESTTEDSTTSQDTSTENDCSELVARCEQARQAAEAASRKAAEAQAAADAARKACTAAGTEVAAAQAALDALQAASPGEGSWVEDVATGRRVTTADVQMENAAAQEALAQYRAGQISAQELEDIWNQQATPEGLDRLRQAARAARQKKIDDAQRKLDQARARQRDVCARADRAEADARAAADAASQAQSDADAACKAADDCLKTATPRPGDRTRR